MQEWFRELEAWHDFYVFAGTAAATLMGLMFVVVSLGQRTLSTEQGLNATRGFFTPIVAFFASDIIVAMLMLMPQTSPGGLGVLLLILGIVGIVYMIFSRAHRFWRENELGYDDLFWYVALPYLAYITIGVSAAGVWKTAAYGLYSMAGAMLLLLIIGIRNAWDLVIYNIQRSSD
jgi:hypothetical protein